MYQKLKFDKFNITYEICDVIRIRYCMFWLFSYHAFVQIGKAIVISWPNLYIDNKHY